MRKDPTFPSSPSFDRLFHRSIRSQFRLLLLKSVRFFHCWWFVGLIFGNCSIFFRFIGSLGLELADLMFGFGDCRREDVMAKNSFKLEHPLGLWSFLFSFCSNLCGDLGLCYLFMFWIVVEMDLCVDLDVFLFLSFMVADLICILFPLDSMEEQLNSLGMIG